LQAGGHGLRCGAAAGAQFTFGALDLRRNGLGALATVPGVLRPTRSLAWMAVVPS